MYGTTFYGGSENLGTAYKVNTDGTGFALLHSFTNVGDGWGGYGSVALAGGALYGTTFRGGLEAADRGAVFKVNTDGTGFAILHSKIGSTPTGLTLGGSTLYGIAKSATGTLFKLNTDGTGFAELHDFVSSTDGRTPDGALVLVGSTLYGLTTASGPSGWGTLFTINTDGTDFAVLHAFDNGTADLHAANSQLLVSDATLYGVAPAQGGPKGSVFKINTDGTGFEVLHGFTGGEDDGSFPGGLALVGSTLYGVTTSGGAGGGGSLFKVNTDGTDYAVVHFFDNVLAGRTPNSLTRAGSALYGVTTNGGASNKGAVFRVLLPCSVDEHVAAHACAACAPGSTRPAGDDPNGADTACTATVCDANEHVSDHTCVACPAGTSRLAGDLATGTDTECTGSTSGGASSSSSSSSSGGGSTSSGAPGGSTSSSSTSGNTGSSGNDGASSGNAGAASSGAPPTDEPTSDTNDDSGCNVNASGTSGSSVSVSALGLLALIVLRRRRTA